MHGVLDLPEQTFMTQLTYYDAETNEKLFSDDLGPMAAGLAGFSWEEIPQDSLLYVKVTVSGGGAIEGAFLNKIVVDIDFRGSLHVVLVSLVIRVVIKIVV